MVRWAHAGLTPGLALVWACQAQVAFEVPDPGFSPGSTLMVVAGVQDAEIWATEGRLPVFSARSERSLLVLYYTRDLAGLGLVPGRVGQAIVPDSGRPLPLPDAGFRALRQGDGVGAWGSMADDDEIFRRLRLPSLPLDRCLSVQGCYASPEDIEARICNPACPSRMVPAGVSPPSSPSVIDFGPCDPGWSPATEAGLTFCAPAEPGPCADDEATWPSATGCVKLGTPCPEPGQWAVDLPADREIIFVRPGAEGGDGTRDAPLANINSALLVVPQTGIIALTVGTYSTPIASSRGLTLWGACVGGTRLEPPGPIALSGPGSGVRNLTIDSPQGGLRITSPGTTAALQDLVIQGHEVGPGLFVSTATATLRRVRIRGTAAIPTPALRAQGAARVMASQLMLDDNGGYSIEVAPQQTRVQLDDARLSATQRIHQSDGAVWVSRASQLRLRSVLITDFRATGLWAEGDGANLNLEQVVLREVSTPRGAVGLRLNEGAEVTLSRVRIEAVQGPAVLVEGGALTADRLYVRDPGSTLAGHVEVTGGRVSLARTQLVDANVWGVRAAHAELVLRDVSILNVARPFVPSDVSSGIGLWLQGGAQVDAQRVLITEPKDLGLLAEAAPEGEETITGSIQDLKITTVGNAVFAGGHAVVLSKGVRDLELTRVRIDEVEAVGVYILADAKVQLMDIFVEDAMYGLRPAQDSIVRIERAQLQRSRSGGLCVRDSADATVTDLVVGQTLGRGGNDPDWPCAEGMAAAGDGVLANAGARLDLERYEVSGCVGTGVVSLDPYALHAQYGRITGNRVGIQLAAESALREVLLDTQVFDNQTDRLGP